MQVRVGVVLSLMFATAKSRLIKFFFFGNSITNDGYLRLAYLLGRFLVFLPLSLCATLVLGIYSLFRPVKIFMLRCDQSKISLLIDDLEVALREEAHDANINQIKQATIFAILDYKSPNRALTSMYGRVVPFLDDDRPFARGVFRYVLPIIRVHRYYLPIKNQDRLDKWDRIPPRLEFSEAETAVGRMLQKTILGSDTQPFVCIGIAERLYYETKFATKYKPPDSADFYRCMPEWSNYIACTETLAKNNIKAIRMGQIVSYRLTDILDSTIIDYATTARSEFGDVWLLANCKFVIVGATGLWWIASAFNKPTVCTDTYSWSATTYGKTDIHIPQLAWNRKDKKLMPFSWIAENDNWAFSRKLIDGDFEIVKNSAEEISEVVLEMNQRIDGTWVETDEDIELQNRYQILRQNRHRWRTHPSVRIGAAFLRRYKHLL